MNGFSKSIKCSLPTQYMVATTYTREKLNIYNVSFKMKFPHLEYGRDHGPDHLHKGKLKIYKVSFKMKFTHLEYGRDHGPDHLHKGKFKT